MVYIGIMTSEVSAIAPTAVSAGPGAPSSAGTSTGAPDAAANTPANTQSNTQSNAHPNAPTVSAADAAMRAAKGERIPGKLIGAIVAVGSLAFFGILTETVMNVLFPQLMGTMHVSAATIQWLTTGYLLVVSITVPLSPWLRRRFLQRDIFIAADLFSIAGCVVMAVGAAFPVLLFARVLGGIGAGLALPLMFNIILEQAPHSKIGQLMGLGTLVVGTAPALGPAVGGFVSAYVSWRVIFIALIPIMLACLALGVATIEQKREVGKPKFMYIQFLELSLGFCGLIVFINQGAEAVSVSRGGGSVATPAAMCVVGALVGLGGLAAFGHRTGHSPTPMIRLGVLRNGAFRCHLLSYMLYQGVTIGFGYIIPNVPQMSMGTPMLVAGLLILPGSLVGALFSPVGGMLLDRFGVRKPILSASVLAVAALAVLAVLGQMMTPALLAVLYVVYMVGFSLCYANIMTSGLSLLSVDARPDGNAMFSTLQQFAGAAGTTVVATVISVFQSGSGKIGSPAYAAATRTGAQIDYAIMAVIIVVVLIAMTRALRRRD